MSSPFAQQEGADAGRVSAKHLVRSCLHVLLESYSSVLLNVAIGLRYPQGFVCARVASFSVNSPHAHPHQGGTLSLIVDCAAELRACSAVSAYACCHRRDTHLVQSLTTCCLTPCPYMQLEMGVTVGAPAPVPASLSQDLHQQGASAVQTASGQVRSVCAWHGMTALCQALCGHAEISE